MAGGAQGWGRVQACLAASLIARRWSPSVPRARQRTWSQARRGLRLGGACRFHMRCPRAGRVPSRRSCGGGWCVRPLRMPAHAAACACRCACCMLCVLRAIYYTYSTDGRRTTNKQIIAEACMTRRIGQIKLKISENMASRTDRPRLVLRAISNQSEARPLCRAVPCRTVPYRALSVPCRTVP